MLEAVTNLKRAILQSYGNDALTIADYYNPDYLVQSNASDEDCIFGNHPTIAKLQDKFGNGYPTAWMMIHLHDLSEFCGCKEKLSGRALQQCASVMASEFYWLKISELILFFHRFKAGRYGRFYGSVDPLVITTSLREFVKERNARIAEKETAEALERIERTRKGAITYEDYLKLRKRL